MAHNPLNQSRGFDAWTFTFRLDWSWSKSRRRLLKRCSASTTAIPVIRNMALEGCFIFQQDSAPGHRAMQRHNRNAKKRNTRSDFVPPTLWPPNSPDLNPVDYKLWKVMQEQVDQTTIAWCKWFKTDVCWMCGRLCIRGLLTMLLPNIELIASWLACKQKEVILNIFFN